MPARKRAELRRAAGGKVKAGSADGGDPLTLVFELLVDMAQCRKRLNDYTEGLLVQVSQKMDTFKAAFEASKSGKKDGKGLFTPRRL